ncbi:MAG: phage tail protein [Piscinibacter sp.]
MKREVDARPVAGCCFRVELADGNGRSVEIACSEVLFPALSARPDTGEAQADEHLVLRRATSADSALQDWWQKACRGRAPQRRTVRVMLLAPDQQRVVKRWRFRNARPLTLHYTPLNAMDSALVMESLAIGFDGVEIDQPDV